jgi:Fur family iron response transcriptional regulator
LTTGAVTQLTGKYDQISHTARRPAFMRRTKALKRPKKARNTPFSQGNIDNFQQTAHFVWAMSMNVTPQEIKSAPPATVAAMASKLRAAGLRPTRQRVAIACLLLDGRHRHVTAESLTAEINASGMRVAGGTVYNTLNQFTDAGFLRRVTVHNEFSLFDTNTAHHHHFYDAADDRLIDIPSDDVVLSRLPQAPADHDITGVDVIIHVTKK